MESDLCYCHQFYLLRIYRSRLSFEKEGFSFIILFSALLSVWICCIIWSYGLYEWRLLGINLHIYTALETFKSKDAGITAQMGYSVGSIFFLVP